MFYTGLIGVFTGLAVARLILSSHEIVNVLIDYVRYLASIIMSLFIIHYLFRYIFRKGIGLIWKYVILILLSNFIIVFLAIVYILVFNLLSVYHHPNPLLQLCSLIGRLSDTDLQIASYIIMFITGIFNMYLLNGITCSSQTRLSRATCVIRNAVYSFLLLILLSIITPWYMSTLVNSRYEYVLAGFRNHYTECNDIAGDLDCLWNFLLQYRKEFISTYRMPCPKPRQLLVKLPFIVDNRDFVAKLTVVGRTGACFDFAIGVAKVLKDLYGYETRVVSFVGWDHTIPEVEVNGTWYVIDVIYTTLHHPIKVGEYAEYLQENYPEIYASLKGMLNFDTGRDISKEHGLHIRG